MYCLGVKITKRTFRDAGPRTQAGPCTQHLVLGLHCKRSQLFLCECDIRARAHHQQQHHDAPTSEVGVISNSTTTLYSSVVGVIISNSTIILPVVSDVFTSVVTSLAAAPRHFSLRWFGPGHQNHLHDHSYSHFSSRAISNTASPRPVI